MRGFNIIDSSHLELRDRTKISRMFKGKVRLDLCDALTGKVKERSEGENTFTNALDSLFNDAPYGLGKGIFGNPSVEGAGDINCTPVFEKALGGVLLFPSFSTSSVSSYYEPLSNAPTGYASQLNIMDVDNKLGSFNAIESGTVTGGYRFVYDWGTQAANGEDGIGAIALTHRRGGFRYFSDLEYMRGINGIGFYKNISAPTATQNVLIGASSSGFFVASASTSSSGLDTVSFYSHDVTSIKLFKDWSSITTETPVWTKTYTGTGICPCYDEASNKIFIMAKNAGNDKQIDLITVDCANNYAETTSTITTTVDLASSVVTDYGLRTMIIVNGFIYAFGKNETSIYKITVSNPADVVDITIDQWEENGMYLASDGVGVYVIPYRSGDAFPIYYIGEDNTAVKIATSGTQNPWVPVSRKGAWLIGSKLTFGTLPVGMTPLSSYLATKFTLNSTVYKTADKTAKLIYTVLEV